MTPTPEEICKEQAPALTFDALNKANVERCEKTYHPDGGVKEWTPTDWACALAGETGEACNFVKKLRRIAPTPEELPPDTITTNEQMMFGGIIENIGKELADVVIYADLLAHRLGLNLGECVRAKFNEVSERVGSNIVLPVDCDKPKAAYLDEHGTFHCCCGKHHSRGPINGVDAYRCLACGECSTVARLSPPSPEAAGNPNVPEGPDSSTPCPKCKEDAGQMTAKDGMIVCLYCCHAYAPSASPAVAEGVKGETRRVFIIDGYIYIALQQETFCKRSVPVVGDTWENGWLRHHGNQTWILRRTDCELLAAAAASVLADFDMREVARG